MKDADVSVNVGPGETVVLKDGGQVDFAPGDVVVLKSGGPAMTVLGFAKAENGTDTYLHCGYYNRRQRGWAYHNAYYCREAVKRLDGTSPKFTGVVTFTSGVEGPEVDPPDESAGDGETVTA